MRGRCGCLRRFRPIASVCSSSPTSARCSANAAHLSALLGVIETMVAARTGNYLVALPSFEYLELVADAYSCGALPAPQRWYDSRAGWPKRRARDSSTRSSAESPVVAFAVLGGVFTESIDLPADALTGIAVIGIGLPPPTLERNEMAECFGEPIGRMLAYEQPAMTRVVQAAGRLIRRGADRGVVCLIDGRFLAAEYRPYLPRHWQPVRATSRQTRGSARRFWRRTRSVVSYGRPRSTACASRRGSAARRTHAATGAAADRCAKPHADAARTRRSCRRSQRGRHVDEAKQSFSEARHDRAARHVSQRSRNGDRKAEHARGSGRAVHRYVVVDERRDDHIAAADARDAGNEARDSGDPADAARPGERDAATAASWSASRSKRTPRKPPMSRRNVASGSIEARNPEP